MAVSQILKPATLSSVHMFKFYHVQVSADASFGGKVLQVDL